MKLKKDQFNKTDDDANNDINNFLKTFNHNQYNLDSIINNNDNNLNDNNNSLLQIMNSGINNIELETYSYSDDFSDEEDINVIIMQLSVESSKNQKEIKQLLEKIEKCQDKLRYLRERSIESIRSNNSSYSGKIRKKSGTFLKTFSNKIKNNNKINAGIIKQDIELSNLNTIRSINQNVKKNEKHDNNKNNNNNNNKNNNNYNNNDDDDGGDGDDDNDNDNKSAKDISYFIKNEKDKQKYLSNFITFFSKPNKNDSDDDDDEGDSNDHENNNNYIHQKNQNNDEKSNSSINEKDSVNKNRHNNKNINKQDNLKKTTQNDSKDIDQMKKKKKVKFGSEQFSFEDFDETETSNTIKFSDTIHKVAFISVVGTDSDFSNKEKYVNVDENNNPTNNMIESTINNNQNGNIINNEININFNKTNVNNQINNSLHLDIHNTNRIISNDIKLQNSSSNDFSSSIFSSDDQLPFPQTNEELAQEIERARMNYLTHDINN